MNVVEYPFAVMADIRRKQALAIAVMAYLSNEDDSRQKKKIPRQRSVWVRNLMRRREEKGAYSILLKEIIFDDSDDFHRYLRMDCETFLFLFLQFTRKIETSQRI